MSPAALREQATALAEAGYPQLAAFALEQALAPQPPSPVTSPAGDDGPASLFEDGDPYLEQAR
jgi:hypothetical protein